MKLAYSALFGLIIALTVNVSPAVAHSSGDQGGMMGSHELSDEQVDRIGDRIAQRFQSMQRIASEQDPAARRELVREHFATMHSYSRAKQGGDDKPWSSHGGGRPMDRGMMGYGMMGYGMMGSGLGPGMMHYGKPSDEQLDAMGEHLAESHARMTRIAETNDKAARRALLREHFDAMREFMATMHRH